MQENFDPAAVVQRQLDAYNQRDLEAFVAEFSDDVVAYRLPDPKPFLEGKQALSEHYRKNRFVHSSLHAVLVNRMVFGNKVIDHERILGIEAEPIELAAIYEVSAAGICKAWFCSGR